jgi:hypothetical protein
MSQLRVTGGSPATVELDLVPGHWEISLEYASTQPVRLTAPGFDQTLPASLDFRGPGQPFPTGGELVVEQPETVRFTLAVGEPTLFGRLIGAESVAFPFRILATPALPERVIPARAGCDAGPVTDFVTP